MTDLLPETPSLNLDDIVHHIARLVRVLSDSDVDELSLETPALKLKLRRSLAGNKQTIGSVIEHQSSPATLSTINAPLVGTFYRAPNPGAEPFVSPGQKIEPGQVVGIIEAMKVMNEITSEISGTVTRVLVEDGQPVEFGQPLMEVVPEV